jgi:tetratricopeptide (TPR) repeat protein
MKKNLGITLGIIILLIIAVFFFTKNISGSANSSQPAVWTDKLQLEYANLLLSKGLNADAAQALEVYTEKVRTGHADLANICNKLGNIYMDLKEYEKALANFYKSELLDPNSDYKQDMNQKIVEGLENLGLSQQAQYELESRTSINPAAQKNGKIVAKIGKREITDGEIDSALNRLPDQVRQELNNDQARLKFIRDYVATEVLYERGKKLGLDRSSRAKDAIEDFKKQLVLQELLRNEINSGIKITPEDISLYYNANKDKYTVPERIKVSFLELNDSLKSNEAATRLKQGKGEKINQWISHDSIALPNIGESKEAIENIFKQEKGSVVNPVKIKDKAYMFIIDEKEPRKERSLEEVKNQVENEYRMRKEQEIVKSLLDKALEQQEVEILYQPEKENEKASKK